MERIGKPRPVAGICGRTKEEIDAAIDALRDESESELREVSRDCVVGFNPLASRDPSRIDQVMDEGKVLIAPELYDRQLRVGAVGGPQVPAAHHLFQVIMLEIMATSAQTGVSVRDLLLNATSGNGHATRLDNYRPRMDATGQADDDSPSVPVPAAPESAAIADAEIGPSDHGVPLAAQADVTDCITPSLPPHLMATSDSPRTPPPFPRLSG